MHPWGASWCWAVLDTSMGLMSLLSGSPAGLGLGSMPPTVRNTQVGCVLLHFIFKNARTPQALFFPGVLGGQ